MLTLAPLLATATEPLFDHVEIDGESEQLHDIAKGWVELPRNERMREIVIAEHCSAVGARRGQYLVTNGQLWLRGLYRCGGDIALTDVYPQARGFMAATWVSGQLVAELGAVICRTKEGLQRFTRTAQLTVDAGRVTAISYQTPSCPTKD